MYNREMMQKLVSFLTQRDGIGDKQALAKQTQAAFSLTKDRSVFYCDAFAVRFCKGSGRSFSNTVLSLSALQKYDGVPFVVCLVTPQKNYLMLANTTFLKRISHSSQELRVDNIKGSFNGGDIMRDFEGMENEPDRFEYLFSFHESCSFQENLERLVEATNNIQPTGRRFEPTAEQVSCILRAPSRAEAFLAAPEYEVLNTDLQARVQAVAAELAIAARIDNVNLRGRIMEFLITSSDSELRAALLSALHTGGPMPEIFTADELGDYERVFDRFVTETDIKSKMLFLASAPKGYNIDKLLSFLAEAQSVYLIFLLAIDAHGGITTRLCSPFSHQILNGTRVIRHWAGRNSRGVTQYDGSALESAILNYDRKIDTAAAEAFLQACIGA